MSYNGVGVMVAAVSRLYHDDTTLIDNEVAARERKSICGFIVAHSLAMHAVETR